MKIGRISILFKTGHIFFIIKSDYIKGLFSACQNHTKPEEELTITSEGSFLSGKTFFKSQTNL